MDEKLSEINQYIVRLSLPKATFDDLSYCNATPEDLAQYLENLPHSNAAELCNRLYKLLPEVAGLRLPPGRKIALLDLVRPEVIEAVQRLTHNLAITAASAKLLSLAIAMLKYLAEGYKSVMVSVLQSPAAPPNLLISASHAAMSVLRQILMECWECYVPPPPNTWLEIHTIYNIARRKELDKTPVDKRSLNLTQASTIRSSYTVPLLMACADPGRYTPQDLRTIDKFLGQSAHLVEFAQNHLEGIFVVDTRADKGPQYSFKVTGTTPDHFRLRTYRLVRQIEEGLATGTLLGLNERLAKDLCKYWSQEIGRSKDPDEDHTPLTLVLGLSHVHRYLSGTRNLDDYLRNNNYSRTGKLSVLELEKDASFEHRDIFLQKTPPPNVAGFRPAPQTLEAPVDTASPPLRQYAAVRTNVSAQGARIEFDGPGETLTSGEVVLLQTGDSHTRQLALVRWTKITHQLKRMLGVQVLSDQAQPCALSQVTATSQGDEQFYPGLLITLNNEQHALLPSLSFKPYSSARLHIGGDKRGISLGPCVESTFHVAIYKLGTNPH